MNNILTLVADWANGLFALLLAGYLTDTELQWWFIPIALLLSHLPDVDAIPELLRYGKVGASAAHNRDHRTLLHFPLLACIVCAIALMFGGFWGMVIAVVIPLHLINDLYGTGWGVPLGWPFSGSRYKFLGRRVNRLKQILKADGDWDTLPEAERRLRLLVKWNQAELPEYIRLWGMDEWIDRWYGRVNIVSGIEYGLFILAVLLTSAYFFGLLY